MGYKLVPGDTPGWGLQIRGKIQTTAKGCAKYCSEEKSCCSYEYSPTEKLCNLNKDCKPTAEKYEDFDFCVKGIKKFWTLNLENTYFRNVIHEMP